MTKYKTKTRIQWIHPSYRDLVIERLCIDSYLRKEFLEHTGIEGVKLAISNTGGSSGKIIFPLLSSENDWKLLHLRCKEITSGASGGIIKELLVSLQEAYQTKHEQLKIIAIMESVLKGMLDEWTRGKQVELYELEIYCQCSILLEPILGMPDCKEIYGRYLKLFSKNVQDVQAGYGLDCAQINVVLKLLTLLRNNEPRILRKMKYEPNFQSLIVDLFSSFKYSPEKDIEKMDEDELNDEKEYIGSVSSTVSDIIEIFPKLDKELGSEIQGTIWDAEIEIESAIETKKSETGTENYDSDKYSSTASSNASDYVFFDVGKLFSDL
jgi:hypothetical protein